MNKKIIKGIFIFILSAIVYGFIEFQVQRLIQFLYIQLSNNSIHFGGKNIFIFPSIIQMIAFGTWVVLFWIKNENVSVQQRLKNGLVNVIICFTVLAFFCFLDSNIKVMLHSSCDSSNCLIGMRFNQVNYNSLICLSIGVTIILRNLFLFPKRVENFDKILDVDLN